MCVCIYGGWCRYFWVFFLFFNDFKASPDSVRSIFPSALECDFDMSVSRLKKKKVWKYFVVLICCVSSHNSAWVGQKYCRGELLNGTRAAVGHFHPHSWPFVMEMTCTRCKHNTPTSTQMLENYKQHKQSRDGLGVKFSRRLVEDSVGFQRGG